jgi:peptide deformylase
MPLRTILTLENPVLRQRAAKVRAVTPQTQALIDDMIETMRAAPGVGLAAPQVGQSQRIIVVEYAEPPEDAEAEGNDGRAPTPPNPAELYVVINPEIYRRSAELETGNEGCLSIPGFFGEVERHRAVTIRGLNRHGRPVRWKAEGWLARIFQHEIDHLDGILFIDRATQVWRAPDDQESHETAV